MDKLELLKTELILLNNEYVKRIDDLEEKYKDKEEIDNDEDYVSLISSQSVQFTLASIVERIEQLTEMEN